MTTPEQYIAAIQEPKRSEIVELHALIRKTVPAFAPAVGGAMLGYGKYRYRYPSGREGESFRIALSSNKTGISVYVSAVDARGWIAEQAREELGKASVGKSCIRFKRLADIDLAALASVLERTKTAAAPGEIPEDAAPARASGAAPKPAKKPVKAAKKPVKAAKKAVKAPKKPVKAPKKSAR
jgi:hypothetical protein